MPLDHHPPLKISRFKIEADDILSHGEKSADQEGDEHGKPSYTAHSYPLFFGKTDSRHSIDPASEETGTPGSLAKGRTQLQNSLGRTGLASIRPWIREVLL